MRSVNRDGTVSSGVVHQSRRRALAVYDGPRQPLTPAAARAQNAQNFRVFVQLMMGGKFDSLPVVATLPELGTHLTLVERSGPIAVPGQRKRICSQLTVPGQGKSSGCEWDPLRPTLLDIGPESDGSGPSAIVVLSGPVGADIHSLELLFQDGSHVDIPIHHGYVLYQVDPKSYATGHQPTTIVARDASGKTVTTRAFWG